MIQYLKIPLIIFHVLFTACSYVGCIQTAGKVPQIETVHHERSEEQAIYNLFFATAGLCKNITTEKVLAGLDRYGIFYQSLQQDGDITILSFSDKISLKFQQNPIAYAYIVFETDDALLEVPIAFDYSSESEAEQLIYRDFDAVEINTSDYQDLLAQQWQRLNPAAKKQDDPHGLLLLGLFEATAVCPGMTYDTCLSLIHSDLFQSEIISQKESDIWIACELTPSGMSLHISFFFMDKKLSCVTITLFPGHPLFGVPTIDIDAHAVDIAPMLVVDIENTWLRHVEKSLKQ